LLYGTTPGDSHSDGVVFRSRIPVPPERDSLNDINPRGKRDTMAPYIANPSGLDYAVASATADGIVINFPLPIVVDDYDPHPLVTVSPSPGSIVPKEALRDGHFSAVITATD